MGTLRRTWLALAILQIMLVVAPSQSVAGDEYNPCILPGMVQNPHCNQLGEYIGPRRGSNQEFDYEKRLPGYVGDSASQAAADAAARAAAEAAAAEAARAAAQQGVTPPDKTVNPKRDQETGLALSTNQDTATKQTACYQAEKSANKICNGSMWTGMALPVIQAFMSAKSSGDMAATCKAAADYNAIAGAVNGGFAAFCQQRISSCQKRCGEANNAIYLDETLSDSNKEGWHRNPVCRPAIVKNNTSRSSSRHDKRLRMRLVTLNPKIVSDSLQLQIQTVVVDHMRP